MSEAEAEAQLRATLADRCALQRELGRGGMATVDLADDIRHDRKVALTALRLRPGPNCRTAVPMDLTLP